MSSISLNWNNLLFIHKNYLSDYENYFTWKLDGFSCSIKLLRNNMLINIKSGEYRSYFSGLYKFDESKNLKLNLRIPERYINMILFGEALIKRGHIKIFLFDNFCKNPVNYKLRCKKLKKIIKEIKDLNEIQDFSDIELIYPENMFSREYSNNINNQTYIKDIRVKPCYDNVEEFIEMYDDRTGTIPFNSDGIIIYCKNNNIEYCLKYKKIPTYDIWWNTLTNKLYSQDHILIGYYYNKNDFYINNKMWYILELNKTQYDFKFVKIRDDKKKANSHEIIKNIKTVNINLLSKRYSSYILYHSNFKLNDKNLLNFEYKIFKEKILKFLIFNNKNNEINWLDIGSGLCHDLKTFLILKNKYFKSKNSNIYLIDPLLKFNKYKTDTLGDIILDLNVKLKTFENNFKEIEKYIKPNSIHFITLFLSIKDFNSNFFKTINRLLSIDGKIAIIFYDSKLIPDDGIFDFNGEFGMKVINSKKIKVIKNNKFLEETNLDTDKITNIFNKYKFEYISKFNIIDHLSTKETKFTKILKCIIFRKKKTKLKKNIFLDNLGVDFFRTTLFEFIDNQTINNLKIVIPKLYIDDPSEKIELNNESNSFEEIELSQVSHNSAIIPLEQVPNPDILLGGGNSDLESDNSSGPERSIGNNSNYFDWSDPENGYVEFPDWDEENNSDSES